jgi:hypothetical protein
MKVGFRSGEDLEGIIVRKMQEQSEAGFAFWGYGGSLFHPTKVIRPFANQCQAKGLSIPVLMFPTKSKFLHGQRAFAKEYSIDNVTWRPLPKGIRTGSPYALVVRNLRSSKARIDLSLYVVGYGPSEHRRLTEYLGFRVDKAVGLLSRPAGKLASKVVSIPYRADLVQPYAVFLR